MDIEEAKVILKEFNKDYEKENGIGDLAEGIAEMVVDWNDNEAIETVLSEIEKKDKIINLIVEEMVNGVYKFRSKKQVIKYFTNKVEEDK